MKLFLFPTTWTPNFENTFIGRVIRDHHLSVSVVVTAFSLPVISASTWSTRISPSNMSLYGEASLLLILCWTCHVRPSYFSPYSLQVSPCGPRSERGDSAAGRGEWAGQSEPSRPSLSEWLVIVFCNQTINWHTTLIFLTRDILDFLDFGFL